MKTNGVVMATLVLALAACSTSSDARAPGGAGEPLGSGTGKAGGGPAQGERVRPPAVGELERVTADLGSGELRAKLVTSEGPIDCELFSAQAPLTVANFVGLARGMRQWVDPASDEVVDRPLYSDVEFHRVIPGFAIQTGDPTGTGTGGPGYVFADEFSAERRHDKTGVLSMANHGPNTNGSQFFVTLKPTAHLDFRHTVFGQCGDLEVIQAIAAAPTGADDRPTEPPVLERIEVYRADD